MMSETKYTILESWPALKDDLQAFIADTDAWIIASLKEANDNRDWDTIAKLINVMEMVHDMSHDH